ncbi:MAG: hypothetical protein IPL25_06490 [Saprospiraceae bacterium]|nr:hypothetical protein [Candidatus Vicinibacter affinis]
MSHDREFLRDLAERTCFFSNKTIRFFEGDIDYFLEKIEATDLENTFAKQQIAVPIEQNISQKSESLNTEERKSLLREFKSWKKT